MQRLSVFTNSTFILLCLNVHTKEFAQKLRNIPFGVHAIGSEVTQYNFHCSLAPQIPWAQNRRGVHTDTYKVPVLRLPPQSRAFRHHAFANVVQHLQRHKGLVVIEAVGELSQADSAWPSPKESVVTYGS